MLIIHPFHKAILQESTQKLCNPDRGFLPLVTYVAGDELNTALLAEPLIGQESMVLLLVDIGRYRNQELDSETLTKMKECLCFFRECNKSIILRVAYDTEGKAMLKEPSSFQLVRRHMEQVGELVREFGKSIYIFQGLLVGNWGEMHGSKFLSKYQLMELAGIIKKYVGEDTYLAVRCPYHLRWIYGPKKDYAELGKCGMGFFDDGLLGSASDIGTYSMMPDEYNDWEGAWNRKKELEFEEAICRLVPNGGEVVYGDGYSRSLTREQLMEYFQSKHLSYLNRLYDMQVLNAWKADRMTVRGVWEGKSVYQYIGEHLGYRYLVTGVKVNLGARKEQRINAVICVTIENVGFSSAYREIDAKLVLLDQMGRKTEYYSDWHLNTVGSGTRAKYRAEIEISAEKETYSLYLQAFRVYDCANVFFANEQENNGVLLGRLKI